jgi:hypothetical protein
MFIQWYYFTFWSIIWIFLLVVPPGSKDHITLYRFNFIHGVICSVCAYLCLSGYLSDQFTTMITISYFVIDFINMLLNDFYFKVKSYQTPNARKVEYCHHILCFIVGISCELFYKNACNFNHNPFVELMFAEVSTPFLMVWRYFEANNNYLLTLFAFIFFLNRIIYHGLIFIPDCYNKCNKEITITFGIPYNLMNIYFIIMITNKIIRSIGKKNKNNKIA